jgi:hypothetical protein
MSADEASQRLSSGLSSTEADGSSQGGGDSPTNSPPGPRSAFGLLARMRNGWRFPSPAPGEPQISDGAKALVFALLTENPSVRLSAERALKDEWLSVSYAARTGAQTCSPPRRGPGRMRAFSSPEFSAAAFGGADDFEALRNARLLRRNTDAAELLSAAAAGERGAPREPPATAAPYVRHWPAMITTRLSESYRDTTEDEDDDDDDPPFRSTIAPHCIAPHPLMHPVRSLLPSSDADDSEPESNPSDARWTTARPTRPTPTTRESGAQRPPPIQRRR